MDLLKTADPRWVDAILDWPGTWLIARTVLTSAYILGGLTKLTNFPAAIAEQESMGMEPGAIWATLTIAVELIGPALIISGHWVWLGAGMLGVFTALAAVLADKFWALKGQARMTAANTFFEHIGLVAAFVLAAVIAAHPPH